MGGAGPLFYQSLDGAMSWQAVEGVSTPSTLMTHMGDFFYAGGSWVLSSSAGIWTSSDGVNWTDRSVPGVGGLSLGYGNGMLVGVGGNGVIYRSTDLGQNWTTPASGTTQTLRSVAYGNGRFVVVGSGGTVLTSTDDGATWVAQASGTGGDLNVTFGNGIVS